MGSGFRFRRRSIRGCILRAEQAKQLPERLKDPVLVPVVERLKKLAARSKPFAAEWDALQYLATGDRGAGTGGD